MTKINYSYRLYIAVGFGGMVGAIGRYLISVIIEAGSGFPFPTLIANLIGCFLLSFLLNNKAIQMRLRPETLTALTIGMIGSFTTFSTVMVETVNLWSSNVLMAVFYILISVFGGLAFCYGGYKLANRKQVNL